MNQPPNEPSQKDDWKRRLKFRLARQPSEESLDVYIPSYPGSPRSLNLNKDDILDMFDREETRHFELTLEDAIEQEMGKATPSQYLMQEDRNILAAAEIDHNQAIAILIRRNADIHRTDNLGRNALHFSVQNGNLEAIEMLLKAGVDPTVKDHLGMTPLTLCLMRNPSIKIARLLFEYGVVILPRSSPMDTGIFLQFVMMCTPTEEDLEIMNLLIEKGATVNDPNAPGKRQALHFAAMSNNCDLIRALVDLGADIHAVNHRNETPGQVAEIFQCKSAFALLAALESAERLSNSNADTGKEIENLSRRFSSCCSESSLQDNTNVK